MLDCSKSTPISRSGRSRLPRYLVALSILSCNKALRSRFDDQEPNLPLIFNLTTRGWSLKISECFQIHDHPLWLVDDLERLTNQHHGNPRSRIGPTISGDSFKINITTAIAICITLRWKTNILRQCSIGRVPESRYGRDTNMYPCTYFTGCRTRPPFREHIYTSLPKPQTSFILFPFFFLTTTKTAARKLDDLDLALCQGNSIKTTTQHDHTNNCSLLG